MPANFQGWAAVADNLVRSSQSDAIALNAGQRASLRAIAERIQRNGVIVADEVGMGKTRIAAIVAKSVIGAGGRVAILVPPGLGFQWREELSVTGIEVSQTLRSIWQFLKAWENEQSARPWFDESAVLVSHAFTNWRLGKKSDSWRWSLLPEMYAHWRKVTEGRLPRGFHRYDSLGDEWVRNAAESIISFINRRGRRSAEWALMDELSNGTPWPAAAENGELYERNAGLRHWLERSVGLGLGVVNLIIIDEAHKSRSDHSSLSRLVEHVILPSPDSRRLAVTATPVELGIDQWKQTLGRIKVDASLTDEAISNYDKAVKNVRKTPNDPDIRSNFGIAATEFKTALYPYLLRRDKRDDPVILQFKNYSGEDFHAYRRETEILVGTKTLSPAWKQVICAAESLSFVTRNADDPLAKRLRLTMGNGHGISTLVDQIHRSDPGDQAQNAEDGVGALSEAPEKQSDKRARRAKWWLGVMASVYKDATSAEDVLFNHPAILAAVVAIEKATDCGEKVLVFGRFTRPMQALVNLLNARQMLSALDQGRHWPQEKVHEVDWAAVQAAHRQLRRSGSIERNSIDAKLNAQYKSLEATRIEFRNDLLANLTAGFGAVRESVPSAAYSLFDAFKRDMASGASDGKSLAVVARLIVEQIGEDFATASPQDVSRCFCELIIAASDIDAWDEDAKDSLQEREATERWRDIEARITLDYSHARGTFARLMQGSTRPDTRRLLQLAFNRKHAFPRVLVAQSIVGREGLNLHKACRTVMLLHPEWNPGVVEQQIGRVDRLGSYWEEKLSEAIKEGVHPSMLPRIEIRPIVFEGTYDQGNWQVLKRRWEDLRAQLHGFIIPTPDSADNTQFASIAKEINCLAPDFRPPDEPKLLDSSRPPDIFLSGERVS